MERFCQRRLWCLSNYPKEMCSLKERCTTSQVRWIWWKCRKLPKFSSLWRKSGMHCRSRTLEDNLTTKQSNFWRIWAPTLVLTWKVLMLNQWLFYLVWWQTIHRTLAKFKMKLILGNKAISSSTWTNLRIKTQDFCHLIWSEHTQNAF